MPDIRMYNGCSACGGSDLSVITRGSLIEITCSRCGHIEEMVNSRERTRSIQVREAELGMHTDDLRGEEEIW